MAPLEIKFRPEAINDIDEASYRYRLEDDGRLLRRFFKSIDDTVTRVALFPRSAPVFVGESRRILLDTFPFWLYYRVTTDAVDILALIHAKRGPEYVGQRTT